MSEELFKAIYSKFSTGTNAFKTATGGQLEYSKAPDTWEDNFAVVQGNGSYQSNLFRQPIDDLSFQINLFSTVRATCWTLMAACIALYHGTILTVTSHYPVLIKKESDVPPIWNENDNLWQATVEFACKIQHT